MILVDSNVLLDVLDPNSAWFDWSSEQLARYAVEDMLAINPLIYAEISHGYDDEVELDRLLSPLAVVRLELPYTAAFGAGRAFRQYKQNKGELHSPMPDFYIGAHADAAGMKLLTRDVRRFRTYFPSVALLTPPGV